MLSIFDLPLILDLVCPALSQLDLYHCTTVSRDWHLSFNPYLWRQIHISRKHALKSIESPQAFSALKRHGSIIRTFSTYRPAILSVLVPMATFSDHKDKDNQATEQEGFDTYLERMNLGQGDDFMFSNLSTLKTFAFKGKSSDPWGHDGRHFQSLLTIVQNCPRLRVLELSPFRPTNENFSKLLQVVDAHQTLKELVIDCGYTYVYVRTFPIIFQHISKLERFQMICWQSWKGDSFWVKTPAPFIPKMNLRELDLSRVGRSWKDLEIVMELLKKTPRLERLNSSSFCYADLAEFARLIEECLPRLVYLDLSNDSMESDGLILVFKACRRLQGLALPTGLDVNDRVVDALVDLHGTTLQELEIQGCRQLRTGVLQNVLVNCTALKKLRAMKRTHLFQYQWRPCDPIMTFGEAAEGSMGQVPWGCLGLEQLQLQYIDLDGDIFPRTLMAQLGALKRLKDLSLKRDEADWAKRIPPVVPGVALESRPVRSETRSAEEVKKAATFAVESLSNLKGLERLELTGVRGFIPKEQVWRLKESLPGVGWVCLFDVVEATM